MKSPVRCILWSQPELANGAMKEQFELLETFVDDSHWRRYLLKCRECGQRYFFEFYEEIDWEEGDDPQYSTFIAVESDEEIETLKVTSPFGLLRFSPRLVRDFPKGSDKPTIGWVGIPSEP
jgi:hypothetical protein